ncbi:MAG: hypothetical protein R2806_03195 [Saprospiraceae bacterium]
MQLNTQVKSIKTLQKSKERILDLECDGFLFAYITDRFDGDMALFEGYDGAIIQPTSTLLMKDLLHRFRSASDWTARLLPIFIHQPMELEFKYRQLVDGVIHQLDQLFPAVEQVKVIKAHLVNFQLKTFPTYEKDTIYKLLIYLLSRKQNVLKAFIDRNSSTGYTYMILEGLLAGKSPYRLLEFAVEEGLFHTEFQDSVYTCNSCEDGFLMYREACPKCHSTYLTSQDLIHHFSCAHIGPEKSFMKNDQDLSCPKCDKSLKHIGIDYDKPAVMHHCNTCHHEFQAFQIVATCCTCHKTTEVEHLFKRNIYTYHVTDKAMEFVKAGADFTRQPATESNIPGTLSEAAFYLNMQYEITKAGKNRVMAGFIRWAPYETLLDKMGRQGYQLLRTNIANQVKSSLQSIDFLSVLDNALVFSCLQCSQDLAQRIVERTVHLLSHLIKDNLTNLSIEFEGSWLALNHREDVKLEIIEHLNRPAW